MNFGLPASASAFVTPYLTSAPSERPKGAFGSYTEVLPGGEVPDDATSAEWEFADRQCQTDLITRQLAMLLGHRPNEFVCTHGDYIRFNRAFNAMMREEFPE